MHASEFAAARKRLGLSRDEMAAELALTPHVVEAFESGAASVPTTVAQLVRRRVRSSDPDAHAPQLPDMPQPLTARALTWLFEVPDRLSWPLRAPPGDAGNGRRIGTLTAAGFSLIALGVVTLAAVRELMNSGIRREWWGHYLGILPVVSSAYFIGFYSAGMLFDATRKIGSTFLGYVVRGSLGAACVYGAMGLVLPLFDPSFRWSDWLPATLTFSALGAVLGAGVWVKERLNG